MLSGSRRPASLAPPARARSDRADRPKAIVASTSSGFSDRRARGFAFRVVTLVAYGAAGGRTSCWRLSRARDSRMTGRAPSMGEPGLPPSLWTDACDATAREGSR